MDPVVSSEWLAQHLDSVVLADARWYLDGRDARREYERGHLPGAVFVDVEHALAAPAEPSRGRHPLPDPEAFAAAMGALGIAGSDVVVAYDDAGGVIAARLVWMLRATGHEAAILDGGILAWPGPLATLEVPRPPAHFAPVPWPADRMATIDDVAQSGGVVIDARDGARFRGEEEPIDPRAGHIPGAVNVPCRDNLDDRGRLLPVAQLRRRFEAAGVRDDLDAISYCGSGVTACHNILVLEHAGLRGARLFVGSWSQWSSDPARPVATGA